MNKLKLALLLALVLILGGAIKVYSLYQAVEPNPIAFWDNSNENNLKTIDHQLWAEVLNNYLLENSDSGNREFNYAAVTEKDRIKLTTYLSNLQNIDPRQYRKTEQLAYWVNLYNALIIDIVLRHYPIASIKDIGDGITGPWNINVASVAGNALSFNQIEHGILRALWQEMRIHYVINCASIGCPDIPLKPLTANNMEQQLETASRRFINQKKGIYVSNNTIVLSSIFHWFSADFGVDNAALFAHLAMYAEPELKSSLEAHNGEIVFDYNWKLNDKK